MGVAQEDMEVQEEAALRWSVSPIDEWGSGNVRKKKSEWSGEERRERREEKRKE